MAVSFNVPKSPKKSILTIDTFQGCDFTNSPANIDEQKSPNAVNMIRDVPGKVRKCMGYETVATYKDSNDDPLPINGYHLLRGSDNGFVHAGENIFWGDILLYTTANNKRSKAWQFEDKTAQINKLYMLDGKKFLVMWSEASGATTSTGKHTTEVDADTYTETLNLKNNDVVNFYMPFECQQIVVTYNGTTATIALADVDTYAFTNTYGNYQCVFEFTASTSVTEYEGVHTSVINSTMSNGYVDGTSGTYIDENGYIHKVQKVEDNAYVPTLTIAKTPGGGGTPYEDLNLLTPAFTEMFQGDGATKPYHLSFTNLDATTPKVWILNNNGEWVEKFSPGDFSYNKTTGIVTFTAAPATPTVGGEDNVKITAYRTVAGYADRINKCTIGILYGVNGASDRLFVSGNPERINYDWYSGFSDLTYFPDTGYSALGTSGSAIIGYSIISNYLAAHKDWMEKDQNIILREGDLVNSQPSFRIINTLQGAGAIAPFSFAYLSTEPLFLTREGVYAVTAQDITGEKYAQNRSYFLDGKLLQEQNLENAYGYTHKDMYWLCLNNVAYILDGLQPIRTDPSMPYSTRQYAGFYRTNLPARVMWEQNEDLYFGTPDGRICRFFTDKYALSSYNDDGEPIEAIWETPDIDGNLFYKNKTLRYIALRLDSALATSVDIWVMNRGLWQFIKKDETTGRYLSFSHLVFSKLSFSGDKTQHTISTKVRVKKVDKFRLRLVNGEKDEPFGLYNIAFEYVENGNYKG